MRNIGPKGFGSGPCIAGGLPTSARMKDFFTKYVG